MNLIEGSQTQGIWIDNQIGGASSNVVISDNAINNNKDHGIYLDKVNNITITNNAIDGNGADGVLVSNGCTQVSFTENDIEHNKGYGVDIQTTKTAVPDPDLTSNTIANNKKGAVNTRKK